MTKSEGHDASCGCSRRDVLSTGLKTLGFAAGAPLFLREFPEVEQAARLPGLQHSVVARHPGDRLTRHRKIAGAHIGMAALRER